MKNDTNMEEFMLKEKIIDNASCISYNRKYYIPVDLETGEVINF